VDNVKPYITEDREAAYVLVESFEYPEDCALQEGIEKSTAEMLVQQWEQHYKNRDKQKIHYCIIPSPSCDQKAFVTCNPREAREFQEDIDPEATLLRECTRSEAETTAEQTNAVKRKERVNRDITSPDNATPYNGK
jgi:hypothetical protein